MKPPRRVVTGLDASGRSELMIDGPAKMVLWSSAATPADNHGREDAGGIPFRFPTSGTLFVFADFPPGSSSPMHATDTLDYLVVVSGEIVFITETNETILRAGDVLVDRGHMHAWRNDSDQGCRIMNVLTPAKAAGKGATVTGTIEMAEKTSSSGADRGPQSAATRL